MTTRLFHLLVLVFSYSERGGDTVKHTKRLRKPHHKSSPYYIPGLRCHFWCTVSLRKACALCDWPLSVQWTNAKEKQSIMNRTSRAELLQTFSRCTLMFFIFIRMKILTIHQPSENHFHLCLNNVPECSAASHKTLLYCPKVWGQEDF